MNVGHWLLYSFPWTSQFLLGNLKEARGEEGENTVGFTNLMGMLSCKAQVAANLCKKMQLSGKAHKSEDNYSGPASKERKSMKRNGE